MKKEGYLPYKKLRNLLFPETYLKISSLQSDWETPKSLLVVLAKYVHDSLKVFSCSKTKMLHVNLQQLRTQFKSKIFLENLVKPWIVILKNPLQTYVWPFFLKILSNLGVVYSFAEKHSANLFVMTTPWFVKILICKIFSDTLQNYNRTFDQDFYPSKLKSWFFIELYQSKYIEDSIKRNTRIGWEMNMNSEVPNSL